MSSSKLPIKSGLEVVKALTKVGFTVRKSKGSHVVLQRGDKFVVVPMHKEKEGDAPRDHKGKRNAQGGFPFSPLTGLGIKLGKKPE